MNWSTLYEISYHKTLIKRVVVGISKLKENNNNNNNNNNKTLAKNNDLIC